jgi:hypothetical protein
MLTTTTSTPGKTDGNPSTLEWEGTGEHGTPTSPSQKIDAVVLKRSVLEYFGTTLPSPKHITLKGTT